MVDILQTLSPEEVMAVQAKLKAESNASGGKVQLSSYGVFNFEDGKQRFWTPSLLNIPNRPARLSFNGEKQIDIYQIPQARPGFQAYQRRLIRSFLPDSVRLYGEALSHHGVVVEGGIVLHRRRNFSFHGKRMEFAEFVKEISLGVDSRFAGRPDSFTKVAPNLKGKLVFVAYFQPCLPDTKPCAPVVIDSHEQKILGSERFQPFVSRTLSSVCP